LKIKPALINRLGRRFFCGVGCLVLKRLPGEFAEYLAPAVEKC